MSNEAIPISPARFAEALKDLPLSTLHLKAAELRNSIAHLDYSNEQLKPFASGTEPSTNGVPDRICVEAINENEVVIARLKERIELLKAEVESRGSSVRISFSYKLSLQLISELSVARISERRGITNGTTCRTRPGWRTQLSQWASGREEFGMDRWDLPNGPNCGWRG